MKNMQDGYLTGKLLLAMPSIGDARFHRSVIFMTAHDEHGAMGMIVNYPLPELEFKQLLDQLGLVSDIKINLEELNMPVLSGGPVEGSRGFLLHSNDFEQDDTVQIGDDYGVTGTTDALKEVVQGKGPDNALFILGYAGWQPGQLESELQQNSWLVTDPDPSLIFHGKPEEKWELAIGKLGFDPGMLSGEIGRA